MERWVWFNEFEGTHKAWYFAERKKKEGCKERKDRKQKDKNRLIYFLWNDNSEWRNSL